MCPGVPRSGDARALRDQLSRAALLLAIVPIIVLILELELVLGFFKGPMRSSFCPPEQLSCCFKFQESV
jgi:hypothetical protein